MFGNRIHFLSSAVDLNLIQRAERIYKIHSAISNFFENKEWIINGKIAIDINDKEDTIAKILKNFKKEILRNTTIKEIPDDFMDNVTSGLIIYYLKYNDNSLFFRYILGRKSELSEYSETLIYNYELLINTLGFTIFQRLIITMAELLDAKQMKVTDDKLSHDLKELLGSTIDIQVV